MLEKIINLLPNTKAEDQSTVLPLSAEEYANLLIRANWIPDKYGYGAIDSHGDLKPIEEMPNDEILLGLKHFALQVYTDNGGNLSRKSDGLIRKETDDSNRFLLFGLNRPPKKKISIETVDGINMILVDKNISRGGVVLSAKFSLNSQTIEEIRKVSSAFLDLRKWKTEGSVVAGGVFNELGPDSYSSTEALIKWIGTNFIFRNLQNWRDSEIILPEDIYPKYNTIKRTK